MALPRNLLSSFLIAIGIAHANNVMAHGSELQNVPSSILVNGELAPPPAGLTDLKFRDFFKSPVGRKGLEVSDKLLGLNGKHVRILGYMAKAESPTPGVFVLSPLPVELGDEDESLSDDLPPSAVFVHMDAENLVVPNIPGLIKLTGTLSVGNQDEADGHVSIVRLHLDPELTADISHALSTHQAKN